MPQATEPGDEDVPKPRSPRLPGHLSPLQSAIHAHPLQHLVRPAPPALNDQEADARTLATSYFSLAKSYDALAASNLALATSQNNAATANNKLAESFAAHTVALDANTKALEDHRRREEDAKEEEREEAKKRSRKWKVATAIRGILLGGTMVVTQGLSYVEKYKAAGQVAGLAGGSERVVLSAYELCQAGNMCD
ncbi:hypothetical protein NBRC10512_002067 [Rhodotorula toruloides]